MPERKTPQVRFKGFTDTWEQRKLGELGKARSGIGFPEDEQGGKEGIPFYKVSDMNNAGNEHEMTTANNYVTREQIARKGWNPIDEVPAIFFAKVGAAVLLNRKRLCCSPFLLDNNTMAYSIDRLVLDAGFAKTLFETIDLTSLVQVGALPSYSSGDVENLDVVIPKIDEQRVIGVYFKNIDHLITLHQRECERLQMVKKSMLENCFPKNGEKVPRFRFAGFTGDWEQRKLGELATFTKGVGYSKSDLKETGTPVVLYGRLYTKYETVIHDVDTFVDAKDGSIYSRGGEVVVPASGETAEDIAIASVLEKSGILIGGDLNIIHPCNRLEPVFLAISISNGEPHVDMARRAQGKSVVHLHNEDLSRIELQYPEIEEQQKIGQCFLSLDHLITLHQSKLEMLKKIKESMLGKILV